MKINGNLQFLGLGQIEGLRVENLATDPASPAAGQVWYNTAAGVYRGFDGNAVITFASGGNTAVLQAEIDALEAAVGANADGSMPTITGTSYINNAATFKAALIALDTAAKAAADAAAAEATRATAAEGVLQTNVDAVATNLAAEVTRATAAEGVLQTNIDDVVGDLAAEVTRATAAEGVLTTDLAAEVTRATGAETTLQANIDTKVSKAGDSMSGNLAMNSNRVTGVGAPTAAADAATKNYVDNAVVGLTWEAPVSNVVADHTALTGLAAGVRVVDTTSNKIFTADGADGFDAGEALVDGAAFFDKTNETGYVFNGTTIVQFTGGGQLTAGIGLAKTGNQLDVNLGAGIAQLPTDEVGVDVLGTGGLFLTVDGSAASTDTAAQLSVKLDGATLTLGAAGIKVSTAVTDELAAATAAIAAEVTRATAAEGVLQSNIDGVAGDLSAEVTRATAAEGVLTTDLAAEVTRATAAEGVLTTNLAAEVTRATGAENAINTRISGGFVVYNGSSAAASHTVVHNIGTKYNNVTVVDSSDQVVIPQSITFDSATQLTVTFNTAITCKVVVSGLVPLAI